MRWGSVSSRGSSKDTLHTITFKRMSRKSPASCCHSSRSSTEASGGQGSPDREGGHPPKHQCKRIQLRSDKVVRELVLDDQAQFVPGLEGVCSKPITLILRSLAL